MFSKVINSKTDRDRLVRKEKYMEKIKLSSGKELSLITCGISVDAEEVTLQFLPGDDSLDALNTMLSDPEVTSKMTLLSESGEELRIMNGYTKLESISQQVDAVIGYTQDEAQDPITGKLVTATLCKPDATEQRLSSLEETVDTLVMESLGL